MRYVLASIKDRSVDRFQGVSTFRAQGEALRNFLDMLNDPNSGTPYKHPDDFDLYVVGHFDDETGELIPQPPTKIADGKQLSQQGKE